MNKICLECGKSFEENLNNFWKYRDKTFANVCKTCMVSHMDYSNIETILPYMKEFDVPYIPECWNRYAKVVNKRGKKGVFGSYLACMNLCSYKDFRYNDTERLNRKNV
jgi:hypothetical protein